MYSLLHRYKSITVAIIAVATGGFFLWLFFAGGLSDITSPSKRCVVEVNSGCVTIKDYRRELLRFSNLLQNPQMEKLVKDQVLSNLIAQELLYQKAKDLSLVASNEEVVEVIKSDPTFHEGGLFSASKYKEILSRNGMTPEEYEDYLRKAISIQKLLRLLTNGVYITEEEFKINLLADSTLLSGSLYLITPSDVKDRYTPTDQELLEYYQKNKELFKRQEGRVVRVWKEKDKEKALSIYKDLKAGKEVQGFQEFRLPEDIQKLGEAINKEAQRLTPQDRVSVFKEGEEYVVVYLKELLPTGYEDFEKVKEKVKEKLIEEKSQSFMLQKAQEVVKAIKEGKKPEVKALNFSQTPAMQLSAVININQKDLVNIVLSQEKVFGPYPLRQGYGVLFIESRSQKEIKKEEKQELFKDILSLKSQAILTRYIEYLEKNSKIKINKELLGGG
ncbi:MAG: peptidylprolyl isomerase [Aquificota bacterium]|jgi:peptidyl-prolyl cis-trans isomerase D|nr:peptidylprolyl isomerase [Aquificaceae bacterium]MDM7267034.1 peptidylprolyl isomerase [Aquificaceae bacterium]QWK13036.1 MAG: peptidylprolyl isomerase [Aquificota bacterium]HAV39520.1 formiminotransferase [Aquificaceae bacterium]HCO39050.1 formiminotransferase [Aquificaceae bacterium]